MLLFDTGQIGSDNDEFAGTFVAFKELVTTISMEKVDIGYRRGVHS